MIFGTDSAPRMSTADLTFVVSRTTPPFHSSALYRCVCLCVLWDSFAAQGDSRLGVVSGANKERSAPSSVARFCHLTPLCLRTTPNTRQHNTMIFQYAVSGIGLGHWSRVPSISSYSSSSMSSSPQEDVAQSHLQSHLSRTLLDGPALASGIRMCALRGRMSKMTNL